MRNAISNALPSHDISIHRISDSFNADTNIGWRSAKKETKKARKYIRRHIQLSLQRLVLMSAHSSTCLNCPWHVSGGVTSAAVDALSVLGTNCSSEFEGQCKHADGQFEQLMKLGFASRQLLPGPSLSYVTPCRTSNVICVISSSSLKMTLCEKAIK